MTETEIEQISNAIRQMDTTRFFFQVERYIKREVTSETSRQKPRKKFVKARKTPEDSYANIMEAASVILSQSVMLLDALVNFPVQRKPSAKDAESDEMASFYLKQLKKHQWELVCTISDEVEMIQNMIKQAEKMRQIVFQYSAILQKTTYLTDVLRDRIANRPTTLLRLNGKDEKLRQLNATFQEMNTYEDAREKDLREEAETRGAESPYSPYQLLMQEIHQSVSMRRQKIIKEMKALHQGWKFLKRLSTSGYSPGMKKNLERLIHADIRRRRAFEKHVKGCRADYYSALDN